MQMPRWMTRFKYPLLTAAAVLIGGMIIWAVTPENGVSIALSMLNEQTPAWIIISAFAVLPVLGFPIAPFLVLLGIRFGVFMGIGIMAVAVPLHLAASYWIANSAFRPVLKSIAIKRGFYIPEIAENRRVLFSAVFMIIPGLSYTLKNLILPLSGVPFQTYFFIGWLIQGIWGILFIWLGEAVYQMNAALFVVLLLLLSAGYGIGRWFFRNSGIISEKIERGD